MGHPGGSAAESREEKVESRNELTQIWWARGGGLDVVSTYFVRGSF